MTIRSNIPACPERPTSRTIGTAREYDIQLITPLFGGGVKTHENDPTFAIRPTSIRGQLQFWWRATVGAQFESVSELREEQSRVWGDTKRSSRIQLRVDKVHAAEPKPCALIEWDQRARGGQGGWRTNWQYPFNGHDSSLPYALFPFQGETPPSNISAAVTAPPAKCIERIAFRLTVIAHKDIDFEKRIEPAIWAWINFGGVGSRTRRGCGTIYCKKVAPKDRDDLKATWLQHMPELFPQREWPTLAEAVLDAPAQADAIAAWNYVIGKFKHFRQGVGFARNVGQQQNRPGRSRYPEPEAIREIANLGTSRQRSGHQRLPAIPADAFPRAELGLPIVFHYPPGEGEPPDTVLYPSDDNNANRRERMASPLILKSLIFANERAIPIILRLKVLPLIGVDLRNGRPEKSLPLPQTTVIREPRLATYANSPLAGSPNGSALDAFIAFARAERFTEVQR